MTITWTEEGIDSYDEIVELLSERSQARAEALEASVLKAVQQISEFPESGRMVPERENPRLREMLVEGYRLIYRLGADGIVIEILVHASIALRGQSPDEPATLPEDPPIARRAAGGRGA